MLPNKLRLMLLLKLSLEKQGNVSLPLSDNGSTNSCWLLLQDEGWNSALFHMLFNSVELKEGWQPFFFYLSAQYF